MPPVHMAVIGPIWKPSPTDSYVVQVAPVSSVYET
jgi:hypothetical protein